MDFDCHFEWIWPKQNRIISHMLQVWNIYLHLPNSNLKPNVGKHTVTWSIKNRAWCVSKKKQQPSLVISPSGSSPHPPPQKKKLVSRVATCDKEVSVHHATNVFPLQTRGRKPGGMDFSHSRDPFWKTRKILPWMSSWLFSWRDPYYIEWFHNNNNNNNNDNNNKNI